MPEQESQVVTQYVLITLWDKQRIAGYKCVNEEGLPFLHLGLGQEGIMIPDDIEILHQQHIKYVPIVQSADPAYSNRDSEHISLPMRVYTQRACLKVVSMEQFKGQCKIKAVDGRNYLLNFNNTQINPKLLTNNTTVIPKSEIVCYIPYTKVKSLPDPIHIYASGIYQLPDSRLVAWSKSKQTLTRIVPDGDNGYLTEPIDWNTEDYANVFPMQRIADTLPGLTI